MASQTRIISIRIPMDLYCEIAGLAQDDSVSLNLKIRQLCMLGIGKHISASEAIRQLIVKTSVEG